MNDSRKATIAYDPVLLAAIFGLVGFGLVMVYSSSAITAQDKLGDGFFFLKRQAFAAAIGLVAMAVSMKLGYRRMARLAYPLLVALSFLLLPALALTPGGNNITMLTIDLPLLTATTGSLAAFYMEAERAQGRSRIRALFRMPLVIAFGTGIAPHLAKAVIDGWRNNAGEFVRTPKQGANRARYKAASQTPWVEIILGLISLASIPVSYWAGHWFATPFAVIFTAGYAYVALLVSSEQSRRRRLQANAGNGPTDTPVPSQEGINQQSPQLEVS